MEHLEAEVDASDSQDSKYGDVDCNYNFIQHCNIIFTLADTIMCFVSQ